MICFCGTSAGSSQDGCEQRVVPALMLSVLLQLALMLPKLMMVRVLPT